MKGADLAHCDRTPELERTGAVRLAHEGAGQDSPDIDTELPVSRQHEIRHLRYYGYPYYWGGTGLWGGFDDPSMMLMTGYDGFVPTPRGQETEAEEAYASAEAARHQNDDPHLRSCKAVTGYHIAIRSRTRTPIRSGTFRQHHRDSGYRTADADREPDGSRPEAEATAVTSNAHESARALDRRR